MHRCVAQALYKKWRKCRNPYFNPEKPAFKVGVPSVSDFWRVDLAGRGPCRRSGHVCVVPQKFEAHKRQLREDQRRNKQLQREREQLAEFNALCGGCVPHACGCTGRHTRLRD